MFYGLLMLKVFLLAVLLALFGTPPSFVHAHHCPGEPPRPEYPRHSCHTRTQTWQPGEPVDRHPGGAKGRGTQPGQSTPGSVYGQQLGGNCQGPEYGGTRKNIPCGPNFVQQKPSPPDPNNNPSCRCPANTSPTGGGAPQLKMGQSTIPRGSNTTAGGESCTCEDTTYVFNYYYINGINTPLLGTGRGNYRWDSKVIRANLLDMDAQPVGFEQLPRQPRELKVAKSERTVFQPNREETYNPSGTEPMFVGAGFCDIARQGNIPGLSDLLKNLCDFEDFRAGKTTGMAPGDILECIYQARVDMLAFAADQPEVKKWARMIRSKYESEQRPREKNLFILIAHSQGNFFAEGVAYRLSAGWEGESGKAVYKNRLGILSFAPPTRYNSLLADFIQRRIKHFTRRDDGIQALHGLAILGAKVPWDRKDDLDPLWEWKDGALKDRTQLHVPFPLPWGSSPLIDTMALAPDAPAKTRCKPETSPSCNPALYTPLMNAHLLENYLADPPLTMPNHLINAKAADYLKVSSIVSRKVLGSPAVLTTVRTRLRTLKQTLYETAKNER